MAYRGKIPRAIEREYITELRKVLKQTRKILEERVLNLLPGIITEYELQLRSDSPIDDLELSFNNARAGVAEYLSEVSKRVADKVAARTSDWNTKLITNEISRELQGTAVKKETKRLFTTLTKARLEGDYTKKKGPILRRLKKLKSPEVQKVLIQKHSAFQYKTEPWLRESLKAFSENNVTLIKSNNIQFLDQSQELIYRSMQAGERHEAIASKLFSRQKDNLGRMSVYRKAETRAAVIARDQVSKLNGNLTRMRQENTGVRYYIWRTAGDGRVRPAHRSLANKRYSWKKGAGGLHPGEDVMCRCYAEPILELPS